MCGQAIMLDDPTFDVNTGSNIVMEGHSMRKLEKLLSIFPTQDEFIWTFTHCYGAHTYAMIREDFICLPNICSCQCGCTYAHKCSKSPCGLSRIRSISYFCVTDSMLLCTLLLFGAAWLLISPCLSIFEDLLVKYGRVGL